MSAPASFSSIVLFTGRTYYAWLRRQKVTTSPDRRASLTPPTALDSGAVRSNLTSSPRLHMPTSLSARCGCCSFYARLQAWLLHVAGEVVVSNSCGNISDDTSQILRSLFTHLIFKSQRIIAFRQVHSNNTKQFRTFHSRVPKASLRGFLRSPAMKIHWVHTLRTENK